MGRPETGRTGARFGAPARRARHDPDPDAPHGVPVEEPQATTGSTVDDASADDVGLTGARFGGRGRKSRKERLAEKQQAAQLPAPEPEPEPEEDRPTAELPRIVEEPAVAIAARPYVLTGGRTKVRAELRIETMVSATGPAAGEYGERHTVITLCANPRSVSEVAALTGVPLGVARVLIDDLAIEGRLRVHLGVDPNGGPDMALLDRVLSGLRRL
ncbi:DUF742 domain-containing protein [Pseudonocardia endophytica]|uniref:Uncharacterized protein DUF742 n=1 Tax=Pseudonocardia endophytica TaxID=401976 RepID=A0A4R1HQH2_PSEEN|nr:DUF742 domain-containing protein [Pseudonocardia endophytica]TCK22975.1 uncharacterized protein DUF742 [Pseudonocardia endophytica]